MGTLFFAKKYAAFAHFCKLKFIHTKPECISYRANSTTRFSRIIFTLISPGYLSTSHHRKCVIMFFLFFNEKGGHHAICSTYFSD